jgi:Domain of unknown function (DUF4406)
VAGAATDRTGGVHAMKLVYCAGPFSGPSRADVEHNIRRAVDLSIEVARLGAMPVCPHANTAHPDFEKVQPYRFWIDATMALLRVCDAVILTPDWTRSSGAKGEAREAYRLGLPVFYSLDGLAHWLDAHRAGAAE